MSLQFPIALVLSIVCLAVPSVVGAEVQTLTATHTYVLGDHDSKEDARQRCLLETKRKILEQAGVYIESESEMRNFDLTKDTITSFAAAVMQIKDTKENFGFENGHMNMTLTTTAQVDLDEVHKQLAARHVDASVRDDVAMQKERLKRLEAQLEEMQRHQGGQSSGLTPASPPSDILAAERQTLRTQAAQGDADAQYTLGTLYEFGIGVPQDYTKAREWYEKAAAQGYAIAQKQLGTLFEFDSGVPQDYAKARQWYKQAAAQGLTEAQYRLGVLYHLGRGVKEDHAKARIWYEKAAAQGHTPAMSFLGSIYKQGRYGVPQDYTKAREWFEKGAAYGDPGAQIELGALYFNGEGVPQDDTIGRQWYEKAAAQGSPEAQGRLGWLYYKGWGVPKDYVRASMWFSVEAANPKPKVDSQLAVMNRDMSDSYMTPAQIAESRRLAQECQARQFKGC
jgi:TPR repeat protein